MKNKATSILTVMVLVMAAAGLLYAGVNLTVSTIFDPAADIVCNGTTSNVTIHYTVSSQAAASADGYYDITGPGYTASTSPFRP